MANEKIPLTYKGHPLRRKDNIIYYGDMSDSHIIQLQILDTKPVGDLNVATKVSIQLSSPPPTSRAGTGWSSAVRRTACTLPSTSPLCGWTGPCPPADPRPQKEVRSLCTIPRLRLVCWP